jgi:hypothetical protein
VANEYTTTGLNKCSYLIRTMFAPTINANKDSAAEFVLE